MWREQGLHKRAGRGKVSPPAKPAKVTSGASERKGDGVQLQSGSFLLFSRISWFLTRMHDMFFHCFPPEQCPATTAVSRPIPFRPVQGRLKAQRSQTMILILA